MNHVKTLGEIERSPQASIHVKGGEKV